MFSRHTFLLMGLLAAGGAPYLSSTSLQKGVSSWGTPSQGSAESESVYKFASTDSNSVTSAPATNPFGGATATSASNGAQSSASTQPSTASPLANSVQTVASTRAVSTRSETAKLPPVDGSQPIRFEEVFRLDVNSAWLMARWPRVSTGLAELNLHGYRVPLVTGKREDDIAGALTYYYDKDQVIQKMTFRGVTGDPRRLVHFATTQYQLEREIVDDPALQVYRTKGMGKRASELTVRPARVIRADAPRERFDVDLVLHR
jgi:hypothetical protein